MARLYVFAEGQTEQTFADTVLKPHLTNHGVYVMGPVLVAHAKKKGKVHRGGGSRYVPMKNDIQRFLKQEKNADVFFTTMIDLYRIGSDFPGLAEAEKLRLQPDKRVNALEEAFAKDIGDARFVPFIQLHEYEAYLFSDVTCLALFYDHHENQLGKLKAIADGHSTPEFIDDGPATAPSKRIIAEIPDYADAKPVVGPQVAELIGLRTIRAKCPHFSAWVSRLENLAGPTP
ncbi:MAG: DUF4276 family protein [Planctomycetes bacterium]|nr:DUF4276 family protein [Planctomycetota bacterium]